MRNVLATTRADPMTPKSLAPLKEPIWTGSSNRRFLANPNSLITSSLKIGGRRWIPGSRRPQMFREIHTFAGPFWGPRNVRENIFFK
jgi:hypothetical protein